MNAEDKALVLFSGGQDSTTCLAWALQRYAHVETIGFDYGQRHRVELDCRLKVIEALRRDQPALAARLGDDHLLDLSVLGQLSESALTRDRAIEMQAGGLPNTFVPGRNLVFLVFAAALAYRRGLGVLVGGMCETDYSGYPDCRDASIKAMQSALQLGMASAIVIETPLMGLDKAACWQLAHDLGGDTLVQLIVDDSHTCYLGDRTRRHAWGAGCGACPACLLRAQGWAAWLAASAARAAAGAASADNDDNQRPASPASRSMHPLHPMPDPDPTEPPAASPALPIAEVLAEVVAEGDAEPGVNELAVADAAPDAQPRAEPITAVPADALSDAPADAPTDAPTEAIAGAPAGQPADTSPLEPAAATSTAAPPATPELSPGATARRLAEIFPALFGNQGPAKPIKLRIQADLQLRAPGIFNKRSLGLFLSRHTTTTAYLKGLVHAPCRFDLDGAPAGDIDAIHREAAAEELHRRRALVDARRAAEREALRASERANGRNPPRNNPIDTPSADRRSDEPAAGSAAPVATDGNRDRGTDRGTDHTTERRTEPTTNRTPNRTPNRNRERSPERAATNTSKRPNETPAPELANEPANEQASRQRQVADDAARRERAALLRSFETSTLTKANFCALKRLKEADLDATLLIAIKEREERPPMPPPAAPGGPGPGQPRQRHDRGPRNDGRNDTRDGHRDNRRDNNGNDRRAGPSPRPPRPPRPAGRGGAPGGNA